MQFTIRAFTPSVPTPPITAPTITATAVSPTRIDIAMTVASTGGVGGFIYELDRSPDNSTWTNLSTNVAFPYQDGTLSQLQLRFYRARAKDTANTFGPYSASVNATTPAVDTTPDAFSFVDQTGVALSTVITSAAITVQNINSPATISVTGGTYDINGSGGFTASSGTVSSGDTVRARHTSSASNATATNTVVTIGGVSDTFTSATVDAIFPLVASSDSRYLQSSAAVPRPILGRTAWHIVSASVATYQAFIADVVAKEFNCIEMNAIYHWPGSSMSGIAGAPTPPLAGNGSLPFTNKLDGSTFTGTLTYSNINTQAPDFTTPNETYWSYLDTLIQYCASQGVLVLLFPSYVGYNATDQGWMSEMVANGQTRMQTFGTFIANRYKTYRNVVWMLGGDKGTPPNNFTTAENAVEGAMITGIQSVTGQLSGPHYSAEWEGSTIGGGSIGTDQTSYGSVITLNGVYSWVGEVASNGRRAYARTPIIPGYYMEGPYDEEGPDGNNFNPNAVQPIRRFNWWGWLSAIGGYVNGNGYVWPFGSAAASHYNTLGAQQCAILNAFIKSINWSKLVPSGLGSIGTLVTAGAGTIDTGTYVASAATPQGDLLVAYVGPSHTGTVTVDMSKLVGTVTCRWFDPTNAAYTSIGSFPNTGTRVFTLPGNNSVGATDWVLRLDGVATGTITHGGTDSIASALIPAVASPGPALFDQGTDAAVGAISPQWSEVSPTAAGDTNYNTKNRNFPITLGTSAAIPAPHSRCTRGLIGGHYGIDSGNNSNANAGYDVLAAKSITKAAGTAYLYLRQYIYLGSAWNYNGGIPNDHNYKDAGWSRGPNPFDPPQGQYYYTGAVLADSSNPQHILSTNSQGPTTPDQNGHSSFWNSYKNPVGRWVLMEEEHKLSAGTDGYVKSRFDNGAVAINYVGRVDAFDGTSRCAWFGGYWRGYGTPGSPNTSNVRAMADSFIRLAFDSAKQLMMTNTPVYGNCPTPEVQSVQSRNGATTVYTPNCGGFAQGSTVYLWWGDFSGMTQVATRTVG